MSQGPRASLTLTTMAFSPSVSGSPFSTMRWRQHAVRLGSAAPRPARRRPPAVPPSAAGRSLGEALSSTASIAGARIGGRIEQPESTASDRNTKAGRADASRHTLAPNAGAAETQLSACNALDKRITLRRARNDETANPPGQAHAPAVGLPLRLTANACVLVDVSFTGAIADRVAPASTRRRRRGRAFADTRRAFA